MSEPWIRASEISEYVYCERAWWLKRTQDAHSQNVRELAGGTDHHAQHGRLIERSIWARRAAYVLFFGLVLFVTFQLLMSV